MRKPEIRLMAVSTLVVDHNVQRPLDQKKVDKIADELDMAAIGVITVSHRDDSTDHVIDGQHRVAALHLAGGDGEKVQSRVFHGLSIEDEARLFRLLNNTTKLGAIDGFRVRVVEGEPVAVAINDILTGHGWKVSTSTGNRHFLAVTAAERVYRRGPDVAELTISTLTRAWGHAPVTMDGRIVGGLGAVFARYGEAINAAELVERLARYPGGPAKMIGAAQGWHELYRWSVPRAVAEAVLNTYNKGRTTRKLPPWVEE